jgi:hypothetical protein
MAQRNTLSRPYPDAVGRLWDGAMKQTQKPLLFPTASHEEVNATMVNFSRTAEKNGLSLSLDDEIQSYMNSLQKRYKTLGVRIAILALTFSISLAFIIIALLAKR